jgi:hypothetical protein
MPWIKIENGKLLRPIRFSGGKEKRAAQALQLELPSLYSGDRGIFGEIFPLSRREAYLCTSSLENGKRK